jgi:hypothetical protein
VVRCEEIVMTDPHLQEFAHWHPIGGTPEKLKTNKPPIGCEVNSTSIQKDGFIGASGLERD